MDIHIPVMDGLEATRQIRRLPQGKDIPIIALSAAAMKQDQQHAIEAGMNAHLAKPIDPDALISMLEKWIEPGEREELEPSERLLNDQAGLPEVLDGFDLNSAIQRLGGNRALLARLLQHFADDYASIPEQITDMLKHKQHDEAAQLIHRMAGAAANLGASELAATAKQIEDKLRSGCKYGVLQKLDIELASAVQGIRETIIIPDNNTEQLPSDISDPGATRRSLEQLSDKLKEYEVVSSTELSELYAQLARLVPQSLLLKLSGQIEHFDYATATATINSMLVLLQTKGEQ